MKRFLDRYRFISIIIGLICVYTAIAYIVLFTIILRHDIQLFEPKHPSLTSLAQKQQLGSLSARVHNVFGDPIPYAVVFIDGRVVQADATGFFTVENLVPQQYKLEIFAGEYQPYEWHVLIEPGTNNPTIKYDTGLWPQFFLPDFHVFHNNTYKMFGLIGFANGSNQPIYIHRASIYNPQGDLSLDLFASWENIEYFLTLSTKIEYIDTPRPALLLPAKTWVVGEIPPVQIDVLDGNYYLEIHYGTAADHERGTYQVLRIEDYLDTEPNWNPHLP